MLRIHLCNWQKFFKMLLDKTLKYAKFLLVFIYTLYIRKVYCTSQPESTTQGQDYEDAYQELLSVVDEAEFSDEADEEDNDQLFIMKMAYANFLIRSNTNRYVI